MSKSGIVFADLRTEGTVAVCPSRVGHSGSVRACQGVAAGCCATGATLTATATSAGGAAAGTVTAGAAATGAAAVLGASDSS